MVYLQVPAAPQRSLNVAKDGAGTGIVQIASLPGGIRCGSDCAESYNDGTVLALKAIPDLGSAFAGWTGVDPGTENSPAATVTMDAAKAVTATFSPAAPLTVTAPNGGESWAVGSQQTLNWNYSGEPGSYVKIQLLRGGSSFLTIAIAAPIGTNGTGSYGWRVPPKVPADTTYSIKITVVGKGSYTDSSNAGFSITP